MVRRGRRTSPRGRISSRDPAAPFRVSKTYETWDEEALDAGDTDAKGYEYEDEPMSLREVLRELDRGGFHEVEDVGDVVRARTTDPVRNRAHFERGLDTYYGLHIRGSQRALGRLLTTIASRHPRMMRDPKRTSRPSRHREHGSRDPAARISAAALAPQRLRDRVRDLKYAHSESYRGTRGSGPPMNPRTELARIRPLIAQARRLVRPGRERDLESVEQTYERAVDEVRSRSTYADLSPGYVSSALERVTLRPAFKKGDRTARGVIEDVGEYSRSDGPLYGVRNERGVFDRVWESTLVWPALHGKSQRAQRRRAT